MLSHLLRIASLLSISKLAHGSIVPRQAFDTAKFDWSKVTPKPTLEWESCYGTRECARFSVPLDWKNPAGETAVIAVVRFKSPLGSKHKDYLGPVFMNPGGPGGSGVQTIVLGGERFAAALGPRFDVIGFDPRGVGFTTPRVSLYPTCSNRISSTQTPPLDLYASEDALSRLWADAQLRGRFAAAQNATGLRYVTTDAVALDTRRSEHGAFRNYGTVLGATFATMFPDNIERYVLDGVVDAENYYATLWNKNLDDTDKALQWFFDACHQAGPKGCAFYEDTPALIKRAYDTILESLRTKPIPVFVPATNSTPAIAGVFDYSMAKSAVFSSMYTPSFWPSLAEGLAKIKQGDATLAYLASAPAKTLCGREEPDPFYDNINEAGYAIRCTDGAPVEDTIDEFKEFYATVDSSFSGVLVNRLGCSGWKTRPADRFTGTFEAKTSFPLLFVGNTADPVTPLANAHKMAKGFSSSVVLTQNSPGHPSTMVSSACTWGYIGAYFVNGTLPAEGTVCEMDKPIFPIGGTGDA